MVREGDQPVVGEPEELGERVFRRSRRPRFPLVGYAELAESDPGAQAPDEPVRFGHHLEDLHDRPVHDHEVALIDRDIQVGNFVEQLVKKRIGSPFEHILLAPGPHAVDDLKTLLPFFHQGGKNLRRILEVSVHDDHSVAPGVLDSRGDRRLVPEIPRETDHAHARIRSVQGGKVGKRVVGASVIDIDDFKILPHSLECGAEAPLQLGQHFLLVENRYDNGQEEASRVHSPSSGFRSLYNVSVPAVTVSSTAYRRNFRETASLERWCKSYRSLYATAESRSSETMNTRWPPSHAPFIAVSSSSNDSSRALRCSTSEACNETALRRAKKGM